MTSRAVRERLAQDVSLWQVDGLVTAAAADVLRERYDTPAFGLATAAKYLGIVGAILAGFGLLGTIGAMSGSLAVGAVELLAVAAGFLFWGLRLAGDPLGRAEHSSRAVLAVGLFALAAAGAAGAQSVEASEGATILVTGLVTVPVAFVLAYRFRNGFLLVLALLATFHWIGSWSEMLGRATYALEIQDPKVMALAAAAAAVVGWLHRTERLPGPARFDAAWMAVGLLYLNLSLLILGIEGAAQGAWIGVWFAAGIAQLAAGAAMKSAVPIGFGVTALAVNLFTRYYEHFWDRLAKGLFFLLGGVLLFGFGFACERLARRAGYGVRGSTGLERADGAEGQP